MDFPVFRITSKFFKVPSCPTFLHLLFFYPLCSSYAGWPWLSAFSIKAFAMLYLCLELSSLIFCVIGCIRGQVNSHLHKENFPHSLLNSSHIGFNFHDNNYHDFIFFPNTFPHILSLSLLESKLDEGRDLVYPFNAASQVSRTGSET